MNEKQLKAKVKLYNENINTNFQNSEIPKDGSQLNCSSVILLHSVFRSGKNYYPPFFLEDCKFFVKEKKRPEYIIDEI